MQLLFVSITNRKYFKICILHIRESIKCKDLKSLKEWEKLYLENTI